MGNPKNNFRCIILNDKVFFAKLFNPVYSGQKSWVKNRNFNISKQTSVSGVQKLPKVENQLVQLL